MSTNPAPLGPDAVERRLVKVEVPGVRLPPFPGKLPDADAADLDRFADDGNPNFDPE